MSSAAALGDIIDVKRFERPRIDINQVFIKPTEKSWEELEAILKKVINFKGNWKTARERFEQEGASVYLETAAEIALEKNYSSPYQMFAVMISKKHGNWETITKEMVEETWKVRRTVATVMEKLKLDGKITGYMLKLGWKFKDALIRFLGQATEQGYNIKNPAGYFFGIIKNVQEAQAKT